MATVITEEIQNQIKDLAGKGFSNRKIGGALGIHNTTVMVWRNKLITPATPPPISGLHVSESDETAGDTRTITLPSTRIDSLAKLIAHCKIDLDIWKIDRFVCNKWEVGAKVGLPGHEALKVEPLFQVKAFLSKHPGVDEMIRVVERLRIKAEKYAPKYGAIAVTPVHSGNVVEISPVDVHHGAQIWGQETGGADYDLKISVKCYKDAFMALMHRTDAYLPESALLIFGHDQQNMDNRAGTTEMLTPQSNDTRYQKVADASCDSTIWAIDQARAHYGKVQVVMVPGNHDALSTWHLGRVLKAWYRNAAEVEIDNSPNMRKYWEHGVNMLLLTHGNKGKLENYDKTMAAEQPAMWGRTRWREAHTGDKHQRKLIENPGCTIRILPSLRPSCAWSAENHYKSIRAAEAFVWNKTEGLIGMATYSILDGIA